MNLLARTEHSALQKAQIKRRSYGIPRRIICHVGQRGWPISLLRKTGSIMAFRMGSRPTASLLSGRLQRSGILEHGMERCSDNLFYSTRSSVPGVSSRRLVSFVSLVSLVSVVSLCKLVQHQGRYAGNTVHCRTGLLILHQVFEVRV